MDYNLWINKAIMKIGALEKEKIFTLKDLFSGIEWNELNRGERLNLGKRFKEAVIDKSIPKIIVIETPKGTATTYKKTKEWKNYEYWI